MLLSHLLGMLLSVEDNESTNPADVTLLRGVRKMSESNFLSYEIEKFCRSFW